MERKRKRKIKDLTNKKFGRLKIVVYNKEACECICDCGNTKFIKTRHLISGGTISCGCKRKEYEDLVGKKFNKLYVVKHVGKKNGKHCWECVCDCGKIKEVKGVDLKSDNTKSCGCLLGELNAKRNFKHGLAIGKKAGLYNPEYEKYLRRNPEYRIKKNISKMIWDALKNNNSSKGGKSVWSYLPYTKEDLRKHLESQFSDWMTWDNYGQWHIDHIKPRSSFNYKTMTEQAFIDCWSLSNLRPLCKIENLKKGNKH